MYRLLIVLILLIPVILGQPIEATCEKGDGCRVDCLEGDFDCTCGTQGGVVCSKNKYCESNTLRNWDNIICCTEECTKGIELEDNEIKIQDLESIEARTQEIKEVIKKPGFLVTLVFVIILGWLLVKALKFKRRYE